MRRQGALVPTGVPKLGDLPPKPNFWEILVLVKIERIVTSQSRLVEVVHSKKTRIAMYCQFYILWVSQPSTRQSLHQPTF